MSTEKLTSDHAKEKHGELMVAVATSILIGIFSALFGSVALKVIENSDQPAFLRYLILLGVGSTVAVYLMIEGLKRIDRARNNREPSISLQAPHIAKAPDGGNGLNIAINHGNTQITICIK